MPYSSADFVREFDVSRETLERLETFDRLLVDASQQFNLIARSTIDTRWDRHFRDSAQLLEHLPSERERIVDLGSGAGFPGIVLAILLSSEPAEFFLVESIGKKTAFLDRVRAELGLQNVRIRRGRIEDQADLEGDVVIARALAALPKLLDYAAVVGKENRVCIFPKGQHLEEELTTATKYWRMTVESRESRTRSGSQILVLSDLVRRPER
ncbi:MAG: 16S rRNA (guanine(527)-N(7))-methyltransferase RsmG [Pseudomonadota bacterium]